ncbi:MAG: FUSC family protein [Rhodanobacteraceae bacterium]
MTHVPVGEENIAAVHASAIGRAFREAVVTMLAALATLACVIAIDPEPGPGILAVVLCLSLSRSHPERDRRGRIEAAIALPLVGLAAIGIGSLLLRMPWVGAAIFVAGMSASIWLRRFGLAARRAGSLIALPLVALLVTPYVPTRQLPMWVAFFMPVVIALLALAWVTAFQFAARRVQFLAPSQPGPASTNIPSAASSLRPVATTRLALQMAVALGASFCIGYLFFDERWAWIVLTAFIVNSGNRGRLDVAYKSVLRVLGAAAGTVLALTLTVHVGAHSVATVGLILAAVFLGMWLRPLGYAWWALFVTLALALLQGFEGISAQQMLSLRLEEIVIGAIVGVVSAWFVYPVRSIAVLRRRIADALAIFADALDPATPTRTAREFEDALARVSEVAPAFRASRLATRRVRLVQPADWIDALLACRGSAIVLIDNGDAPGDVRKAISKARAALREPAELRSALTNLRIALDRVGEAQASDRNIETGSAPADPVPRAIE